MSLKKSVLIFIVIYFFSYYGWLIFLQETDNLKAIGGGFFSLIGILVAGVILLSSVFRTTGKSKVFWLLLLFGISSHVVAEFIWFYYDIAGIHRNQIEVYDSFYSVYHLFLIIAIFYLMFKKHNKYKNARLIIDAFLFLVVIGTISTFFIIEPMIKKIHTIQMVDFTLIYPFTGLICLFGLLNLLLYRDQSKKSLSLLTLGVLVQFIVDYIYFQQSMTDNYESGHWLDPLWILALLLIALSSLYDSKLALLKKDVSIRPLSLAKVLPHISIIVLMFIMFSNDNYTTPWLFYVFSLIIVIVIVRQVMTMFENQTLVTELNKQIHIIEDMAYYDSLTGLPNRLKFTLELQKAIARSKQNGHSLFVLFIDLDRFKSINDTMGHSIGDQLLTTIAERLRTIVGQDKVARFGGDEFLLYIEGETTEYIQYLAAELVNELSHPLQVNGQYLQVTPSIGISPYMENTSIDTLIKNADTAMYIAKEKGKNTFEFFTSELQIKVNRKRSIEKELRFAIARKQFQLSYQPQVHLHTGQLVGLEVLLRWEHPEFGVISPHEFIPIAEETGLIMSIGEWVLTEACLQQKKWVQNGSPSLKLFINISQKQIIHHQFISSLRDILEVTRINPSFLGFELSEQTLDKTEIVQARIHELHHMGFTIAIDDFGTGYSSLSQIMNLPIDMLKIDLSFIRNFPNEHTSLIKSMIDIGINMNLVVVAEGIESIAQMQALHKLGCECGQGYLYNPPLTAEQVEAYFFNVKK
ncbi:putative bifunctional diguanylate cyclase/phosphodiesterase [Alkalihalobacterium bogoriense]|uniref:putative bifunctional diguanylate cyclase/phosphodiesterase n=1 Tax=Alkalihalobacterium bogoriense TaxID=246272 RepID=UPI00047D8C23|nr:EAL domain-containing protein [Alkalihalobacterium bogoriense]